MAIKWYRKPNPNFDIDPGFAKSGEEKTLAYGRKSNQQGEGVPSQSGTFDRDKINPDDEEDEYPRSLPKNWKQGHVRSDEDLASATRRSKALAKMIKF